MAAGKVVNSKAKVSKGTKTVRKQKDDNKTETQKRNKDPKVNVGDVSDVSGEVNVAGRDIYKGFTAEQVTVLIDQIKTGFREKNFDGTCPYKGLDVFDEEDAELFFGRKELVKDLVSRVKDSRTLFVTGPSGSGKSSLVRAGLIPALKNGQIKASKNWLYETMKPGQDAMGELARVASSFAKTTKAKKEVLKEAITDPSIFASWCDIALGNRRDRRAVLFIDQFEEVFTQLNKEKAETFINLLTYAATIENGRVIILFSMRSDFVSNCATYPKLNELLNQEFVQIGSMQPNELVSAIAQPALHVGLQIDPELIAYIINEMKGEPGTLPLMQFALVDLFDSKQKQGEFSALELKDYISRGGIREALKRHADKTLKDIGKDDEKLASTIFKELIVPGQGTQDTRQTVNYDELIRTSIDNRSEKVKAAKVIEKLVAARLIIKDEIGGKDTVTISHEKLIEAWPWLIELVNKNREAMALKREIEKDAANWDKKLYGIIPYTGPKLKFIQEKIKEQKIDLKGLPLDFIKAGQRRQLLNQFLLIGGLSLLFVLLVSANVIFANLRTDAQNKAADAQAAQVKADNNAATAQAASTKANEEAAISRAGELAGQSLAEKDKHFDIAMLLGLEGYHTLINSQTKGTLLTLMDAHPGLDLYLFGHQASVSSLAFSSEGKFLASGSWDKTIIFWDVNKHQPIGDPLKGHTDKITSVAFSPDDKLLVSGSWDGTVILWDVNTHQRIGEPLKGNGQTGKITSVSFGKTNIDNKEMNILAAGSEDGTVNLWDVSNPSAAKQIGNNLQIDQGYSVTSVAISRDRPDGKLLLAAGSNILAVEGYSSVTLWDISDPYQPIHYYSVPSIYGAVSSLAFSPSGGRLAIGSLYYYTMILDLTDPTNISRYTINQGHGNSVLGVAFDPSNDNRLASSSNDNTIKFWDISDLFNIKETNELSGSSSGVTSIAFNPNGKYLASGSSDNAIILWNLSDPKPPSRIATLAGINAAISSVAFMPNNKSPNGDILAAGSYDPIHSIFLWKQQDYENNTSVPTRLSDHTVSLSSINFSSNGNILVSGSWDNTFKLWDMTAPNYKELSSVKNSQTSHVFSVALSPNGNYLAVGGEPPTIGKAPIITLWDVKNPTNPLKTIEGHTYRAGKLKTGIASLTFSPDSNILASGSSDTNIILWDVSDPISPSKITTLSGHSDTVNSLAFSPNGNLLASGSDDNSVIVWSMNVKLKSYKQPLLRLNGHQNAVTGVAFSPDGKILASSSRDNTVILWDISNLNLPYQLATLSDTQWINSISFSPDGKRLAGGGDSGVVIIWDFDPQSWIKKICQRVGRNFTRAEWAKYGFTEHYHKTCDQWPLEPEVTATPTATP